MTNRKRYLGALCGYLIVGIIINGFVLGDKFVAANITASLPALLMLVLAIIVEKRWAQIIVPIAFGVLFVVYYVHYFSSFGA